MSKRMLHCSLDIECFLESNKRKPLSFWSGMFRDSEGCLLSAQEGIRFLNRELNKGHKLIPIGDGCEGFDPITGCPGHSLAEGE